MTGAKTGTGAMLLDIFNTEDTKSNTENHSV